MGNIAKSPCTGKERFGVVIGVTGRICAACALHAALAKGHTFEA